MGTLLNLVFLIISISLNMSSIIDNSENMPTVPVTQEIVKDVTEKEIKTVSNQYKELEKDEPMLQVVDRRSLWGWFWTWCRPPWGHQHILLWAQVLAPVWSRACRYAGVQENTVPWEHPEQQSGFCHNTPHLLP